MHICFAACFPFINILAGTVVTGIQQRLSTVSSPLHDAFMFPFSATSASRDFAEKVLYFFFRHPF